MTHLVVHVHYITLRGGHVLQADGICHVLRISFQAAKVSFVSVGSSLGEIQLDRSSPTSDLDPSAAFLDDPTGVVSIGALPNTDICTSGTRSGSWQSRIICVIYCRHVMGRSNNR